MAEDDSSNAASAALVGRLRCQIGEQDRRIRELEPNAEAAAEAAAAQAEVIIARILFAKPHPAESDCDLVA